MKKNLVRKLASLFTATSLFGMFFMPFGFQSAHVFNNANTHVNSFINSFATNNTGVFQTGFGFQNANVNNKATSTVHSTINAFSTNNTSINQF